MPSDRTLILRRAMAAVAPAQAPRKERAQFGRRNGSPTCRTYYCGDCGHVFSEVEVPDAQCPLCGAKVA